MQIWREKVVVNKDVKSLVLSIQQMCEWKLPTKPQSSRIKTSQSPPESKKAKYNGVMELKRKGGGGGGGGFEVQMVHIYIHNT